MDNVYIYGVNRGNVVTRNPIKGTEVDENSLENQKMHKSLVHKIREVNL